MELRFQRAMYSRIPVQPLHSASTPLLADTSGSTAREAPFRGSRTSCSSAPSDTLHASSATPKE